MIVALRQFWVERTRREQRLLLVLGLLVAGFVLWLGVARPLAAARERGEARLAAATADAGAINARLALLDRAPRQGQVAVATLVTQSASAAGLQLSRNDATAGGVAVSLQVRAPALFAWLQALDARGVIVEQLSMKPTGEGTVSVDATLRARR